LTKKKAKPAPKKKKKRKPRPKNFKPRSLFARNFREKRKRLRPRCQAWNGNAGRQCINLPVKGRGHPAAKESFKTVCGSHGGRSPSGPDHPRFKHGRYSKDLPANLAADYQRSLGDPDLVSLRQELALVDLFNTQDVRKLYKLEDPAAWGLASELFRELESASQRGELEAVTFYMDRLRGVLRKGLRAENLKDRIVARFDVRRKLSDSERRTLIDLKLVLTVERQMALLGAVAALIAENVKDPDERKAIAGGLRNIVRRRALTDGQ
jgi:hypothetical protein